MFLCCALSVTRHLAVDSITKQEPNFIIIIIIIIIFVTTFMHGIYNHIPATNHVSKV